MKNDIDKEVHGVLGDAFDKYRGGAKKHGELELMKDPRDFLAEAEAELLDVMVYASFEIIRIRRINAAFNKRLREIAVDKAPPKEKAIIEALEKTNASLKKERDYLLRQIAGSDGRDEEMTE